MPPNEALHKQQSIKGGIGNEKVWKRIVNHAWSNCRYSDCNSTVIGIIRSNRSLRCSSRCHDHNHLGTTNHIRPRNYCWDYCRTTQMKKIWLWTDICSEPCLFFISLYERAERNEYGISEMVFNHWSDCKCYLYYLQYENTWV